MGKSIVDDIVVKMGEPAVPAILEALAGLEEELRADLPYAKKITTEKRISRLVGMLGFIGGKEAEAALVARKDYPNEITKGKVEAALLRIEGRKLVADKPASDITARAGGQIAMKINAEGAKTRKT